MFANTGVSLTPVLANSYNVGSCQMGTGMVGWFTSSHNVAGVVWGKSWVLNVIAMSGGWGDPEIDRTGHEQRMPLGGWLGIHFSAVLTILMELQFISDHFFLCCLWYPTIALRFIMLQ